MIKIPSKERIAAERAAKAQADFANMPYARVYETTRATGNAVVRTWTVNVYNVTHEQIVAALQHVCPNDGWTSAKVVAQREDSGCMLTPDGLGVVCFPNQPEASWERWCERLGKAIGAPVRLDTVATRAGG